MDRHRPLLKPYFPPFIDRRVPLVSVVIEGGASTIRNILNNVTSRPPIPVVVFDGTGRAADIIAFTHKYASEDGYVLNCFRPSPSPQTASVKVCSKEKVLKVWKSLKKSDNGGTYF